MKRQSKNVGGFDNDLDRPTGEMSPRVTWMQSLSGTIKAGRGRWWEMAVYENGHRRLKGWEVGHFGRYCSRLRVFQDYIA